MGPTTMHICVVLAVKAISPDRRMCMALQCCPPCPSPTLDNGHAVHAQAIVADPLCETAHVHMAHLMLQKNDLAVAVAAFDDAVALLRVKQVRIPWRCMARLHVPFAPLASTLFPRRSSVAGARGDLRYEGSSGGAAHTCHGATGCVPPSVGEAARPGESDDGGGDASHVMVQGRLVSLISSLGCPDKWEGVVLAASASA